MDNVTFITINDTSSGDTSEQAIIDHGNGEYTSMLKSTYDAQQATLSTPIVSSDG